MTSLVAPPLVGAHRPNEDRQTDAAACLLLALEGADARRVVFKPIARLGDGFVAATVMIDLGDGGTLPFDLECCRLAAQALRFDPSFPGSAAVAAGIALAADQAEAQARRLMAALH